MRAPRLSDGGDVYDAVNAPRNAPGRSPESRSRYRCPTCGRRLVYLAQDRLQYCRACQCEYGMDVLDPRTRR